MQVFELLNGSDVEAMRKELRLSRDALMAATTFTGKSAARISNIERKESWNEGDREVIARAFWALYAERGLEVPPILSFAECDPSWESQVVHPGHDIEMQRRAEASEAEYRGDTIQRMGGADTQVIGNAVADPAPCAHAGGFTRAVVGVNPQTNEDVEAFVCAQCGQETPQAEAARRARDAMNAGNLGTMAESLTNEQGETLGAVISQEHEVGAQVEVAGQAFTKVSNDPFPTRDNPITIDATPAPELDEEWEETLTVVQLPADQTATYDGEPPTPEATQAAFSALAVTAPAVQADYTLTHSEIATYKRCKRKWWLAYYRELGPIGIDVTSARATGGRIHRALEMTYSANQSAVGRVNPKDALERVIVEDWTKVVNTVTDPTELALVKERFDAATSLERAMIEGYIEWLAETGADADYIPIGAEQVLAATFPVKVDDKEYLVALLGKLDARLRRRTDGALLFIDHKTVQSLTDVVPTLRMNEQMLVYVLLEALNKTENERVAGALYNMLRKVKRTARANPPFYDRLEVRHNQHELGSMFARVQGVARDILRTADALDAGETHWSVAYPTPTTDCRYDCDFFRVCPLFDDGSPGVEEMLASAYMTVDPLERYDGIAPARSTVVGEETK